MSTPRLQFIGRFGLIVALVLVTALATAGCDSGSSGGGGDDPAPVVGGGTGGGTGGVPLPPNVVQVHEFTYDTVAEEFTVKGEQVALDDVARDLVGTLCENCHNGKADELKDSVHYKIAGRTDRVMFPGGGAHGMLDRACGLPATTGLTNYLSDINLGECAKCHVGRYMPAMEGFFASMFAPMGVSDPQGEATKLVNGGLDCLICHAENYTSVPSGILAQVAGTATVGGPSPTQVGSARASRDNGDFNHDGFPDLVIDMNGDGTPDAPLMYDTTGDGQPDTPWPTVAQDRSVAALSSIGKTNEHTCLRCHEHARTGYKRGTLFAEGHDVHATISTGVFADAENQCTACHTVDHHKYVRGHMVGGDLAAADYPAPPPGVAADPNDPTDLTCEKCHEPASLSGPSHLDSHLAVISCETCHIPYASGITYSLFGHGGHLAFGRNAEGKDTKLVVADMQVVSSTADTNADAAAYRTRPILMWFNGGTSFLAQSLAVKGMPNAKITPFKPMANGMVFDSRFFSGQFEQNTAGTMYNAHSMYRFFANGNNAEAFAALGLLDMTPNEVRNITMAAFMSPDPDVQTMALMLIFPNLVYFDKASFGFEHYLTRGGSPFDGNGDGVIDAGQDFNFDMFKAANDGLRQFQGFNGPMQFPADYEWYPPFGSVKDVISMKLPDGSLIKMFLQMQAAGLPANQQGPYLDAVANYPSFSNVTLGGHGVLPKEQALGAGGCTDCHDMDGGALMTPQPVGRKIPTDLTAMGFGWVELPIYRWKYYQVQKLTDLGLATQSEEIVAGTKNVDIDGNAEYLLESDTTFTLNWLNPSDPTGYRPADDATALVGTGLTAADLTWNGGKWMPVLEPVTDLLPTWKVLGLSPNVIWN